MEAVKMTELKKLFSPEVDKFWGILGKRLNPTFPYHYLDPNTQSIYDYIVDRTTSALDRAQSLEIEICKSSCLDEEYQYAMG